MPVKDCQIVYPEGDTNGTMYAAVSLQFHFLEKEGLTLPLATAESAAPGAKLRMLHSGTLPSGHFTVAGEGDDLCVTAGDLFGFEAAVRYLTGTLFTGKNTTLYNDKLSYEGGSTPDFKTRAGDYRVIFQNVWFHNNDSYTGYNYGINSANYEASLIEAYRPDVFGFNEFIDNWRDTTDILEIFRKNGYSEAQPKNDSRRMITPVFYNPRTVKLLDCVFTTFGSLDVESGIFDLSVNSRWSGAVTAVFEVLATGERFAVCAVHLESNTYVTPQIPEMGDPLRVQNLNVLIPALKKIHNDWQAPVIVGGDYNSTSERAACTTLKEAGFVNTRDAAAEKNNQCSCHGYPIYNAGLNAYTSEPLVPLPYSYGIDQIFSLGELDVCRFRTLDNDTVPKISDHCPVMIDFSLNRK